MQTDRRIHSIDVTRGVVMVLMAIDHVRIYAGVPPGGPRPGVLFTRWITNFVAPTFAFFAGTSAYLLGRWTFNFDFGQYLLASVIWMLGWCMVLLAALIWLPIAAIGAFGMAVICLHNLWIFCHPRRARDSNRVL